MSKQVALHMRFNSQSELKRNSALKFEPYSSPVVTLARYRKSENNFSDNENVPVEIIASLSH